jgi:hypothetical protein
MNKQHAPITTTIFKTMFSIPALHFSALMHCYQACIKMKKCQRETFESFKTYFCIASVVIPVGIVIIIIVVVVVVVVVIFVTKLGLFFQHVLSRVSLSDVN